MRLALHVLLVALASLSLASSDDLIGRIESGASVSLDGQTIQLARSLTVSNELTLSGPGTIQCSGIQIAFIAMQSLSIQGKVTFLDCPMVAVSASSSVSFKGCSFINSSIASVQNASVSILDCYVEPNPLQPVLNVTSATSLTVSSTQFNASLTTQASGITALDVGSISITSSLFLGLSSGYGYGAAISAGGAKTGSLSLLNTSFVNNSASMPEPNAALPYLLTTSQLPLGGALMVDASTANVTITSCTFQGNLVNAGWSWDSFDGGGGGAVAIVSANKVSVSSSTFSANNANGYYVRGGALLISSASSAMQSSEVDVSVSSCSFQTNFAGLGGGAIALLGSASSSVTSSSFTSNTVGWRMGADDWFNSYSWYTTDDKNPSNNCFGGGILAWPSQSDPAPNPRQRFVLRDSKFVDNSATLNGGGLALRGFSDGVLISNNELSANLAGFLGGGIHMADFDFPNATIIVTGTNFTQNSAGFYGYPPSDQAPGHGGAMSIDKPAATGPSSLLVTYCNMVNNSAGFAGGAFYINNPTSGQIANSTFNGNMATLEGGAMVSITCNCKNAAATSWIFNSTLFINNTAGGVILADGNATMLKGKSYGGALSLISNPTVWISEGTSFINNQASLGGAIFGMRISDFNIGQINPRWLNNAVTFRDNRAVVGGAIMMIENCNLRLGGYHIVFHSNLAVTGGALALFGSYVNSLWPTFTNNSALLDSSLMTDIQLNWASQLGCGVGNGGAVCLSGYPTELTIDFLATAFTSNKAVNGGAIYNAATGSCGPSCFRLVVANCTLVENVAVGGGGGGVFWLHEESTRNICQANTTLELLTAIYTNQMYTRGAIADKFGSALPCVEWMGNRAVGGYGDLIASSPFSLGSLPFSLYYNSNDPLSLNISVLDFYGQQVIEADKQNQVLVEASSEFISDQTEVTSSNGTAAFTSLKLRTPPGLQPIIFTAKTPIRELKPSRVIIQVRPCVVNEYTSPGLGDMCLPCAGGSYNLDPSATSCIPCPDNAFCSEPSLGGGIIVPSQGFWNSNPFDDQLVHCLSAQGCSGTNRSLVLAQMQSGMLSATNQLLADFYSALLSFDLAAASNSSSSSSFPTLSPATASILNGSLAIKGHAKLLEQLISDPSSIDLSVVSRDLSAIKDSNKRLELTLSQQATLAVWIAIKDQPLLSSLLSNPDTAASSRRNLIVQQLRSSGYYRPGQARPGQDSLGSTMAGGFIIVDLPETYQEGVCTDGYEGNVCAACSEGWGAAGDDVTCTKCSNKIASAFYYTLTTLLTLAFLAFLLRTSVRRMDFIRELSKANSLIADAGLQGDNTLQHTLMVLDADGDGVISIDEIRALDRDGDGNVTADEIRARINANNHRNNAEARPIPRPAPLVIEDPTDAQQEPRSSETTRASNHPLLAADFGHTSNTTRTTFTTSSTSERATFDPKAGFSFSRTASGEQKSDGRQASLPEALEHQVKRDGDLATLLGDSPILKILISYLQVIVMVRLVGLDLGPALRSFYYLLSTVTSIPGKYISIDCSLPYAKVGDLAVPAFKEILSILSPIYLSILIVILIIVWRPIRIFVMKLCTGGKYVALPRASPLKDYAAIVILGVTFFLYPTTTEAILSIFVCVTINVEASNPLAGEAGLAQGNYWYSDLDQQCYSGYHLALVIALGAPGLVLFALGLPLFNYGFLVYFQKACHENLHFISVYQFMFEGFKARCFGWESVVMGRKLLLSIAIVFMTNYDAGTQLLVMLAILMLALMLQTTFNPYESEEMNQLERLSLWATIITLYLSLYLAFSPTMTQPSRMAISGLILGVNAVTLGIFAYFIVKEYYGTLMQSLGLNKFRHHDQHETIDHSEIRSVLEGKVGRAASTVLTPVLSPVMMAERKLVKGASFVRESIKRRISSSGMPTETLSESRNRLLRNVNSLPKSPTRARAEELPSPAEPPSGDLPAVSVAMDMDMHAIQEAPQEELSLAHLKSETL